MSSAIRGVLSSVEKMACVLTRGEFTRENLLVAFEPKTIGRIGTSQEEEDSDQPY